VAYNILTKETIIFTGIYMFAEKYGLCGSNISKALKTQKPYKNWIFNYSHPTELTK